MPYVFGLNQGVFRVNVDQRGVRKVVSPLLLASGTDPEDRTARGRESAAAGARCVWRADPHRDGCRQGGCALKVSRRLAVVVALVIAFGAPAAAYLKLGTRVGGRTVTLEWRQFPIRYFITNRDVDGVTAPQLSDRGAARVSDLARGAQHHRPRRSSSGFTQASPTSGDGATVLGFQNRPELDRTLAATELLHRHDDGRDRRIRHLLQFRVHMVHIGCRRLGALRRRVHRAARDRTSLRPLSFRSGRDRAAGGRPAGPRR